MMHLNSIFKLAPEAVARDVDAAYKAMRMRDDYSFISRESYMKEIPHVAQLQLAVQHPDMAFSKWGTLHPLYLQYYPCVHRKVSPLELVFDCDAETYDKNRYGAYIIANVLESLQIPFNAFYSGNKGMHVHVFYDIDPGCSYSTRVLVLERFNKKMLLDLRKWLFERVFASARKYFTEVDKSVSKASAHMIREAGSVHYKTGFLKTYVGSDSRTILNKLQPIRKLSEGDLAEFPPGIKVWHVPEALIIEFLSQQKKHKQLNLAAFSGEAEDLNGKYRRMCERLLGMQLTDGRKRAVFAIAGYMKLCKVPMKKAVEQIDEWLDGHVPRSQIEVTLASVYNSGMVAGVQYLQDNFGDVLGD